MIVCVGVVGDVRAGKESKLKKRCRLLVLRGQEGCKDAFPAGGMDGDSAGCVRMRISSKKL